MGAATESQASPELVASRVRRNVAEGNLMKLARSEDEKKADFAAISGIGKTVPGKAGYLAWESADQIDRRIQKRRQELAAALPSDTADATLKDAAGARVRRARGGSSRSALGSFDPSAPIGPDSILGGR